MVDNTCNSSQQYVQAFCALNKQASLDTSQLIKLYQNITYHLINVQC